MNVKHIPTISEYHDYIGWPRPDHPQISVLSFEDDVSQFENTRSSSPPISTDFYIMKLVLDRSCGFNYGRTRYDFSNGSLAFIAPNQVHSWENYKVPTEGVVMHIHKDYFHGFEIEKRIKQCAFFSYTTSEALHLSPKEEGIVKGIFLSIAQEYKDNPDVFSKEIIHAHIDSLLTYTRRFYSRQFIDRKEMNQHMSVKFNQILQSYFNAERFADDGLPSVEWLSEQLSVSTRYLSDALRAETGKTTQELIHLFVIDEAKNLLLVPGNSVSQTAYQLGFEYPQYFSRLFKKKVGISPKEFQEQGQLH